MTRQWVSGALYIGAIRAGSTEVNRREGDPNNGRFQAACSMPGGAQYLGYFETEDLARHATEQAASKSIFRMFGHGPREIDAALKSGPDLRKAARALYTIARWTPDRDIDGAAFWEALRCALDISADRAPAPTETETPAGALLAAIKAARAVVDGDTQGKADAARALDLAIVRAEKSARPENENLIE